MRFTEIGQQLRAYRLESGLRAEEIAARLGVSRAALYRYEKGEVIKLDTVKRLAELLKISPLSLLGIGVEYYNRPVGYFERVRQTEETADQVLQVFGPLCYLTTSDAYDACLAEAYDEVIDMPEPDRAALRMSVDQIQGIQAARKRMYGMRRPGIIAILSVANIQRLLDQGIAASLALPEPLRRRCRQVAAGEIEHIATLDGNRADGAAVRRVADGGTDKLVQDPALARPGDAGHQSVPLGRAAVRANRGGDDHRGGRGGCDPPAGCRDHVAGVAQRFGGCQPYPPHAGRQPHALTPHHSR